MKRNSITNLVLNKTLTVCEDGNFKLESNDYDNLDLVVINEGLNVDMLFNNFNISKKVKIVVKKDAHLTIKGLIDGTNQNLEIYTENDVNSELSLSFIDFSQGKSNITVYSNTDKDNATYNWNMASLSAHEDDKKITVNLDHNAKNLNGNVSNYGICKDGGKLLIAGISHILPKAEKTATHQNAKIMLIDEKSHGIAKPILRIDENDVVATHGASLGQINEDQLFYLMSRGLSEAESKRLVILGYFNPIVLMFKDEECEESIISLVKERV